MSELSVLKRKQFAHLFDASLHIDYMQFDSPKGEAAIRKPANDMEVLDDLRIDDLTIIGQSAEKEVIFCYHVKKRRIICFDQHACDERIRYERLLSRVDHNVNLDRIKSQACHGAIRFGKKLTIDQCHDLITRLLNCKVPFRCAHSRCGVSVLESIDKILFIERIREDFHAARGI